LAFSALAQTDLSVSAAGFSRFESSWLRGRAWTSNRGAIPMGDLETEKSHDQT
jgi:hypothetical protein